MNFTTLSEPINTGCNAPAGAIASGDSAGRRRVRVLVGVCSARGYAGRRAAVRETWMASPADGVHALFFFGEGTTSVEDSGDIVTLAADDSYDALPAKVMAFFKYALEHFDFEWIFKCDDDTYVAQERLLSILDDKYDLIGDVMLNRRGAPSGGAGYFLSRKIVERLVALQPSDFQQNGPEDLIIGKLVIEKFGAPWLYTPRLCFDFSRMPRRDNDVASCHWCSPQKLRIIHRVHQSEVAAIYEGLHPEWQDKLFFYTNGLLARTTSGCTGEWTLFPDGRLSLRWHEWPEELLFREGREFSKEFFKLVPVEGDLTNAKKEPVRMENPAAVASLSSFDSSSEKEKNDRRIFAQVHCSFSVSHAFGTLP